MNYRFPFCERCGTECVGLQVTPGSTAPIHCIACVKASALAQGVKLSGDHRMALQLAFDNSLRALEHEMVNPPRRKRASIGWGSLTAGILIGAGIASTLWVLFGGHF